MGRRLLLIAVIIMLLAAYYVWDAGTPAPTKAPATQPSATPTGQTPVNIPDTPAQPAETKQAKAWPYLTREYKVAMADDLLARNIVLIFDGSGSMSKEGCSGAMTKIQAAKKAVAEWSGTVPSS